LDAPIEKPYGAERDAAAVGVFSYKGLSPETTAFDIDGVVADTMRLFIDIARDSFRIRHLRHEDIISYNLEACLDLAPTIIEAVIQQIIDGTHAPRLRPIAGCRQCLARFGKNGQPVHFVTARPEAGVIRSWLENNLPLGADQIEVVATGGFEAKAEVLQAAGIDVFVEDRLETCFHLSRTGITPILFVQPWNRSPHPFREVSTWEEIGALLAE
jgi:uncharacterized HAD superfamily protein